MTLKYIFAIECYYSSKKSRLKSFTECFKTISHQYKKQIRQHLQLTRSKSKKIEQILLKTITYLFYTKNIQ